MAAVTFPPSLGGDGSTITDDANATTGLANGGHRTRFVPALAQTVAVMNGGIAQAQQKVSDAAAQVVLAQNQVGLAANQVSLATAQANNAASSANAAAASAQTAINSPGTNSTSTTSVAIGTGSKTFTVQTGKAFVVGQPVMVAATAAPSTQWMAGNITAYNSGTGSLTVDVVWTRGTGTLEAWTVSLAGPANPAAINKAGDTMTGALAVPAGASGAQVPQVQEVVKKAGDTMTGPLAVPAGASGAQVPQVQEVVKKSGDTMTGDLTVPNLTVQGSLDYDETVLVISTNTTAVKSRTYVLVASLTLTLPASPQAGDWITVSNRSATVTAVIARNGQNIMGLAEDMTVDNLHAGFRLVFADATRGWVLET